MPAATLNTVIKTKTYESALEAFRGKYAGADIEYGAQIDSQGFVSSLNKGGSHEVIMSNLNPSRREVLKGGIKKGVMEVHNHPSGGNFSDIDLLGTAKAQSRGIVATGVKNGQTRTFSFVKGTHFDAVRFSRALSNAQLRGLDYTHAADNWLRANQKRYGYRYTTTGYVSPSRSR